MYGQWINQHYKVIGNILINLLVICLSMKDLEFAIIGALICIFFGIMAEIVPARLQRISYLGLILNTFFFPECFPGAFLIMPPRLAVIPLLIFLSRYYHSPNTAAVGLLLAAISLLIRNLDQDIRISTRDYLNENDAHREFEKRLKLLEESRRRDIERSSRESVLEERNRIARSLHDYIGHTVSSAIMQLEAFKLIHLDSRNTGSYGDSEKVDSENGESCRGDSKCRVGRPPVAPVSPNAGTNAYPNTDTTGTEQIDIVIHTLKSGMVDIRTGIHHLFDASLDMEAELYAFKEKYPAFTFSIAVCNTEEMPYHLKQDLLRIVGELVSNVARHSDADTVKIVIDRVGEYHTLLVKDNGSVKIDRVRPGLGMEGIKIFADKHYGNLNYSYFDGFQVHIRFKIQGKSSMES